MKSRNRCNSHAIPSKQFVQQDSITKQIGKWTHEREMTRVAIRPILRMKEENRQRRLLYRTISFKSFCSQSVFFKLQVFGRFGAIFTSYSVLRRHSSYYHRISRGLTLFVKRDRIVSCRVEQDLASWLLIVWFERCPKKLKVLHLFHDLACTRLVWENVSAAKWRDGKGVEPLPLKLHLGPSRR